MGRDNHLAILIDAVHRSDQPKVSTHPLRGSDHYESVAIVAARFTIGSFVVRKTINSGNAVEDCLQNASYLLTFASGAGKARQRSGRAAIGHWSCRSQPESGCSITDVGGLLANDVLPIIGLIGSVRIHGVEPASLACALG